MNETTKPAPAPAPEAVNMHRLVRCLEEVEGGEWYHPGGKLCFKRSTWQEASKLSYVRACDPYVARSVAALVLSMHESKLMQAGHEPTVRMLARCWREGLEGAMSHRETGDYSQRVENLYKDKEFAP